MVVAVDERVGARALRRLGRLKLRGALRRGARRLRTVKGAFLTLCGVGLFVLWGVRLAVIGEVGPRGAEDLATLPVRVGAAALLITILSLLGALTHRGLFIPQDEIERLLAAPVSRAALIRYRLRANVLRSLVGALLISLVVMRRMPSPPLAFLGILLGMLTLPVLHQLVAILAGRLELGVVRHVERLRRVVMPLVLVVFLVLVMEWGMEDVGGGVEGWLGLGATLADPEQGPWRHPLAVALTLPLQPWARMIAAEGWGEFWPWCLLGVGILVVLVESTARLPVDFRELSLATSSDVAARLRRARGGGGAAAGRVSRRTLGWRLPWLFGRGPAGAVAWRKTGSILRKARGTVVVSLAVLAFVTWGALQFPAEAMPVWGSAVVIASVGTLYLSAGLRFDFREELDRMPVLKAWPLAPWRLFLALLAPQTALVSLLVIVALVTQCLLRGDWDGETVGIALQVPAVALAWIALDNVVFLFAPVRFVPGQEGALQNTGRAVLLMLLRFLLAAVAGGLGALAFWGAGWVAGALGGAAGLERVVSFAALGVVLLVTDAALVALGGLVLRRFDVARDRG